MVRSFWKLFLVCLGSGFAAATMIDMVPAYSGEPQQQPAWVSASE